MRADPFAVVCLASIALGACAPLARRLPPPAPVGASPVAPAPAPSTSQRVDAKPAPVVVKTSTLKRVPPPDPVVPETPDADPVPPEVERIYADGVAAHQAGRFDEALQDWERVWKLSPGYEDVEELLLKEYLVRGLEAFSRGSLDDAIGLWEKAQEIRPEDARVGAYLERAREQRERQTPLQ